MNVSKFNEKFNKIDGNIYTVEEVVTPVNGLYEAELIHDNINVKTINIYTGSKLTGDKINTYVTSTPSLTPWKTVIKIFSDISTVYISYETTGDTVEADDINNVQDAIVDTQNVLNSETARAINREYQIENNLNLYKTTNNAEIQGLKAKDIDLDNKKSDLSYVNGEFNNRYTKDQVFTKDEVLQKIKDLIGNAPQTLDTFKEIADALGDDPNFATTIMNALAKKVDKVDGKQLSTNDYDNTEKATLADVNSKKHTHPNKNIIDTITQALLNTWNAAYSHISDTVKHITSAERTLWNTVSNKLDLSGGTLTGSLNLIGAEIRTGGATNKALVISAENESVYLRPVKNDATKQFVVNGSDMQFNGNKVYHAGDKPGKSDVGLSNVDNTSDMNKPISTATQTALNNKSNNGHTHDYLPLTGGILTGTGTLLTFNTERAWSFMQGGTGAGTSLDLVSSTGDKAFRVLNSSKTYGLSVMTSDVNPTYVTIDNNKVYHAGSKPTPAEIGASANGHTHDDRYYTESECDAKYATKDQISKAGYGDMLKSTYDTDGDGVVNRAESIKCYITTNSVGSYSGYYTKIASVNITSQYANANLIAELCSSGAANYTQTKGTLHFKVKQQDGLGAQPGIDLKIHDNEVISASNFVGVITSNTTSATTVELYYKAVQTWDALQIIPILNENFIFYNNQPYINSLPSGTQIACSYTKKALTWNDLEGI